MRPVPAVAGFGERVGSEGGEGLGCHQLVDGRLQPGVIDDVEVVDDLRSLVAQVAEGLEAGRPAHATLQCRADERTRAAAALPTVAAEPELATAPIKADAK